MEHFAVYDADCSFSISASLELLTAKIKEKIVINGEFEHSYKVVDHLRPNVLKSLHGAVFIHIKIP